MRGRWCGAVRCPRSLSLQENPGAVRRGVPAGVRTQRPRCVGRWGWGRQGSGVGTAPWDTALLPCRLGTAVPPAGPDSAPLHGRLRHLQEEVAPAQGPGGQPPPHRPTPGLPQPHGLHVLPHPGGCTDGDNAVPGQCLWRGGCGGVTSHGRLVLIGPGRVPLNRSVITAPARRGRAPSPGP